MKFLAVIGDPISHSKSPRMHNNAIKALGLDSIYTRYHLRNANCLREDFFKLGLSGANITLPFKEKALDIADVKDDFARNIGSANTLCLKEDKIYAYNTDALGFLEAIKDFDNIKKALILGAGGTALALAYTLKQKGIEVYIANRSKERFKDFLAYRTYLYKDLQDFDFDLVINSTSAGLKDENLPCDRELLGRILPKAKFAFEVIYGRETPFYRLCKEYHLKIKDGLDMLLWQGVFAFELFFEIQDKREMIKNAMQQALILK
ncbi:MULTISPECIES: shikimate dehydrogenase [Campylobacter]|uniref:Shikimate dehydrogenase (NADP(+)) n=1 Tax=Campylobacter jejuni TaxID=197 RepID=A0A1E7NIQ7_CAMJU|nr:MULTISPECIES: shikimate dehydrogenase [Campylobacter]EIB21187.1 shikimate 5-dehydrogenase [Campylobacter jejuni subsp. jejuni LMG 23216]EAB5249213.1 shikimate dehydrogenase [Campylobacter jejuni]EAI2873265.1 shikimate dehydrogenase [Campylobacter jejuni]EAI2873908.1 shikimate dehydrogenase [Campylobacter jejuni]EAK2412018.1 shikimate dehydrogenase [Campylobacter jejuni]